MSHDSRHALLAATLGAISLPSCAPAADFPRQVASNAIGDVDVRWCGGVLPRPGADPVVHVSVTLSSDGSAQTVRVDRGLEDIGADAASCLIEKFRELRVPTFHGGAATLGRTFLMQPHDAKTVRGRFDRGEAARTLGERGVQICRSDGGPTGSGHLRVRFASDGTIVDAWTDQPPFAGTDAAICVEQEFIGRKIPPYGGSSVVVGKSFFVR